MISFTSMETTFGKLPATDKQRAGEIFFNDFD